ncbi:MAG: tetratricopeptide repeat protein [Desulfobacterales bacterium]
MAKQRISRSRKRELQKPDEFISFTGGILQAVSENRRRFIVGGAALIVVILAVIGFRYHAARTEENASRLLQAGLEKMEDIGPAENASDPLRVEVKRDLEMVVEKYPGKKAGKIARILLADIAAETGEYESALMLYERALKDFNNDPFYTTLILKGLAYANEQSGNLDSAMAYMKSAKAGPDLGFEDEVLYHLGRLASEKGMHDEGAAYYRELLESHPDSIYADLAEEEAAALQPDL